MKILKNNNRYLTQDIVEQCFESGKDSYVDKVICGNGFSTAFMNIVPPKDMLNVMIAPNRAVVTSKEESYRKYGSSVRTKFFYKDSTDFDFSGADLLVFVSDSFLLRKNGIDAIGYKIDKVLIDEAHSVEIQSLFRKRLIDFIPNVRQMIGDRPALVCVTATPNHYTKITHRIDNVFTPKVTINRSRDFREAILRVRDRIDNGERVLVATNDKNVLYRLKDANNRLEADYIIGDGLMASMVELVEVKHNPDSKLKIISSRGFEGFDLMEDDYSVFFFEDRGSSSGFQTFYISNLYQAINRVRKGAKYIEYVRRDLADKRSDSFKDIDKEIDDFISRDDISIYQKQSVSSEKKLYKFHPYVIFSQDDKGKFSVKRNDIAINLYKETRLYDSQNFVNEFDIFLKDRNVQIVDLMDSPHQLEEIRLKDEFKEDRLLLNEAVIKSRGMFEDGYTLSFPYETAEPLKVLKRYIRRKDYNKKRGMTFREGIAYKFLSDKKEFQKLSKKLTETYNKRSIDKYGMRASKSYRDAFKKKSDRILLGLIQVLTNERITVPSKWVANRDYNILTEVGVDEIKLVAKEFNVEVTEVDVNSAFIRIIYSICGIKLPEDFYGKNKENKLSINVFLNDFFYNPSKATPKKIQKIRAIEKFRGYNFDEAVISFLIDNFFESRHRGNLFHFLTFYEKQLVSKLKAKALEEFQVDGLGRRHDSLILFNNQTNLQQLNHLDFMGFTEWFKIDTVEIEESYAEWYNREIAPQVKKEVTKKAVLMQSVQKCNPHPPDS